MTKEQLKTDIFKKIGEYYKIAFEHKNFIPGETRIPASARVFDADDMISLTDAVLDFWLTEGRFSKEFQSAFCKFLNVQYTILTNSGSSANLIAFSALTSPKLKERRIHPGDEVITVASTFPTTVNPIIQNGCIPVFVDIDLHTLNADPTQVKKAITKKTKAIFLVHTLGNPFDLGTVIKLAKKYNLFVIEDTCDSLGSTYNNQYVSTFGDMGTYSFYPAHHITMGEGGAVVTNNSLLKTIVTSFRDWGRDCWCDTGCDNTCRKRFGWQLGNLPFGYDHKFTYAHAGYNLKLTDLQAAVGVMQLKKLPVFIKKRRENFILLYNKLKKYKDYFLFTQATPKSNPSWFGFPLTIKPGAPFSKRDITTYLEDKKILTRIAALGNITRQPYFKDVNYRIVDTLKNSDYVLENTFWIGLYPGITKEMINYMAKTFDQFIKAI